MNPSRPYIVSISAVSGGGKTTITNRLKELLPKCTALYFDEYDFNEQPEDICDWVERGADYSEWNLFPILNDLSALINSKEKSLDYILLDYPFSRLHRALSNLIDFSIFIDTPLDIAMARRVLRDYKDSSIEDIFREFNTYLSRGRYAYLSMLNKERNSCDAIIDGSDPIELIVKVLFEKISRRSRYR